LVNRYRMSVSRTDDQGYAPFVATITWLTCTECLCHVQMTKDMLRLS